MFAKKNTSTGDWGNLFKGLLKTANHESWSVVKKNMSIFLKKSLSLEGKVLAHQNVFSGEKIRFEL